MAVFLLVDCNNFYASCQRVFNPKLENRPVVVLSNNDGCVIARSNQAKDLGIPMGAPYFQYRSFCETHKVAVFSSNYELYGDFSQRVMSLLRKFCDNVEVYSIDEAFLRFESSDELNIMNLCETIRQNIKMWTGIPVSIGIGTSKTLAKAANLVAKRQTTSGIFDLRNSAQQDSILMQLEVSKIWGIGSRIAKRLAKLNITHAQQLRDSSDAWIREHFGVTVQRTILELRGISCLNLETCKPKKNIISSRSFSSTLTRIEDLEEALSQFVAIACQRLRKQESKAQGIYVFLQTNPFTAEKFYNNGILCSFAEPTADTSFIIQAAKRYLKKIYLPQLHYKKMGVMLTDLIASKNQQYDLFIKTNQQEKKDILMHTLDHIQDRMGRKSIFIAAQGTNQKWQTQSRQKSPCYTTQWADILTIKI